MRVRDLKDSDIPILREWHTQSGFDYPFPELGSFEAVRILVDEGDTPVQAVAARKTVELYLLVDSGWKNPRWRLDGIMKLHEDMGDVLAAKGFTDAHLWCPPQIAKSFGRRLERVFGWVKSGWASYSRKVKL